MCHDTDMSVAFFFVSLSLKDVYPWEAHTEEQDGHLFVGKVSEVSLQGILKTQEKLTTDWLFQMVKHVKWCFYAELHFEV